MANARLLAECFPEFAEHLNKMDEPTKNLDRQLNRGIKRSIF